jgi:L-threonate 2-dehydrogenase
MNSSKPDLSAVRVAVIGLGAMGFGMAESLRRAGAIPHVFDLRPDVVQRFVAGGGVACVSVTEAARQSDVILSVVVNAQQTEALLFGEQGALPALGVGKVFVMCSTVPPAFSMALEGKIQATGAEYLDAPISGGAKRAANGELTMMTAGRNAAYALCNPVLEALSAKVYRLGDKAGAGSKVKIINQLLAGVHIAAAAEAMALGIREGVAPADLYEVITHSAGNSWMFENRMPHVVAADYTPSSAVDIFVKDLGLVLDTGRASKFPLPMAATAHQMFMHASSAGFGAEDDSAVIKIFPGITLPQAKADE